MCFSFNILYCRRIDENSDKIKSLCKTYQSFTLQNIANLVQINRCKPFVDIIFKIVSFPGC